jgi:hypothetical protein
MLALGMWVFDPSLKKLKYNLWVYRELPGDTVSLQILIK